MQCLSFLVPFQTLLWFQQLATVCLSSRDKVLAVQDTSLLHPANHLLPSSKNRAPAPQKGQPLKKGVMRSSSSANIASIKSVLVKRGLTLVGKHDRIKSPISSASFFVYTLSSASLLYLRDAKPEVGSRASLM